MKKRITDFMGNCICGQPPWRGSNCSLIFDEKGKPKTKEFQAYLKNCPPDSKNRLHYYSKSYFVSKVIQEAGINSVFHIGFGKERYLYSYQYHGMKRIMGCDIDRETQGGNVPVESMKLFSDRYGLIFNKSFMEMSSKDLNQIQSSIIQPSILLSEATFYWLSGYNYGSWSKHLTRFSNLSESDVVATKESFRKTVSEFRKIGFDNFMFIEQDCEMFKNLFDDLEYKKISMNDNFRFEFLLDYEDLIETVVHLYSNNSSLINSLNIFGQ